MVAAKKLIASVLVPLACALTVGPAYSDEPRYIGLVTDFADILQQAGERAEDLIQKGRVARQGDIRAWFAGDTDRYGHGVLGDALEAETLVVEKAGKRFSYTLGDDSVFEDLEPRIADIDGDGEPEFIAIKSYLYDGAAVAVYGFRNGKFQPLAEAQAIGTANRWLNPAGVADFDGDGEKEIAVIRTPHIGGVLQHYSWDGGPALTLERRTYGYSTHRIGSTLLDLSVSVDWNSDGVADLVLPRQDHKTIAVVTWTGDRFEELAAFENPSRIATRFARMRPAEGKTEYLIYGREDGTVQAIEIPPSP